MSENKEKYSKFIEYRFIQAVLRRKYNLTLWDASRTVAFLHPLDYYLLRSFKKSFMINDNLIIHAKDITDYGCRYYIEEI